MLTQHLNVFLKPQLTPTGYTLMVPDAVDPSTTKLQMWEI